MSWLQQLYETYGQCSEVPEFMSGDNPLLPICHTTQNAHLEVVINGEGKFLRAKVLEKGELSTVVPCTEGSAGRSGSKPVNHPLCDKLQYIAGDYLTYGGDVTVGYKKNPSEPYQNYLTQLGDWISSDHTHPKAQAIFNYVSSGSLIKDLVTEQRLHVDDQGKMIKRWVLKDLYGTKALQSILHGNRYSELMEQLESEPNTKKQERIFNEYAPAIFKILPAGQTTEAAFIRWKVEVSGQPLSACWEDRDLMSSWIAFYGQRESVTDLCMVTGETSSLATQHPSGIRHGADKAKLISSNDSSGFTFRGRFTDKAGHQACSIASEVTQKAHNTLRWLVQRKQAYRFGDQVFVSWAVSGEVIPDPLADTHRLLGIEVEETIDVGDVGQAFAQRLSRCIAGYQTGISDTQNIIVMGLDSATPGRMAITYYRELERSEFLERIQQWHQQFAWHQNYSKDIKFVGAPAPRDIAEVAYGRRLDDKLKKSIVERLLPCIIDRLPFPNDLLLSCTQRVSNRVGMERWEWEKALGISCALIRGKHQEENYEMSLEEDRTTRDYLYGRMLALADYIEEIALIDSEKNRPTNAARLMPRFASNPATTWPVIYSQLRPYFTRLKSSPKTAGRLVQLERLLSEISAGFESSDDFNNPKPLKGEYLLAYYCQRKELWKPKATKAETTTATAESIE